MEYTSVSDLFVNREGNNRDESVALSNDIQNLLSFLGNRLSSKFVLKSDVEALVQDASMQLRTKLRMKKKC